MLVRINGENHEVSGDSSVALKKIKRVVSKKLKTKKPVKFSISEGGFEFFEGEIQTRRQLRYILDYVKRTKEILDSF